MDFYVYAHRKATTGEIFYIGKGTGRRAWNLQRNSLWSRTVKKHGLIVDIVQAGLREWAAHEIECDLIALHGRRDCGHGPLINLTDGGEGASNPSKETRQKIKDAWKKLMADPEVREKKIKTIELHCRSTKAKANHLAAMSNPEYKKKLSASTTASMAKPEIKAKHRAATILATREAMRRPDVRERHLAALMANKNNPEVRLSQARKREEQARRVRCIETGEVFKLARAAEYWLRNNGKPKAQANKIHACCSGGRKTAYGYTWKYADTL